MLNVAKYALIIIGSVVIGGLIVMLVQMINHQLYPPPTGVDFQDPEQLKAYMPMVPLPAKILVVASWAAGMFGGGLVGLFISGRKSWPMTVIVGLLFLVTCSNFLVIPHPVWMIASAFGVAILAWLGAKQFARS